MKNENQLIRIKLEHQDVFGSESIKIISYIEDIKEAWNLLIVMPYLSKLSEEELDHLCNGLTYNFNTIFKKLEKRRETLNLENNSMFCERCEEDSKNCKCEDDFLWRK